MRNGAQVADNLRLLISSSESATYVEARYQLRVASEVNFINGELARIRVVEKRAAELGFWWMAAWGFTGTSNISNEALKESLNQAIIGSTHTCPGLKKNKVRGLAESKMVQALLGHRPVAMTCWILTLSRKCRLQRKQKRRLEAIGQSGQLLARPGICSITRSS